MFDKVSMRFILTLLLVFVMVACSNDTPPEPTPNPEPIPSTPEPEPNPTPEPEPDPNPDPAPPSGSLDESFGEGGKVVLDESRGRLSAVTTQFDGNIVAAGNSEDEFLSNRFLVTRFKTDGSLDQSFNSDGLFTTATGVIATDLIVTSDNLIHAVGRAPVQQDSGGFLDCGLHVRLGPDNFIDDSLKFCASSDAVASEDIATDSQGRLVSAYLQRAGNELIFTRMSPNGQPDETFGNGGKATLFFPVSEDGLSQLGDRLGGLVILPNDQMLLVTSDLFGTPSRQVVRAARFSATGELITIRSLSLPEIPGDEFFNPFALTLDNEGRAVVAGGLFKAGQAVLLRFDPFSFELDKTLSENGIFISPQINEIRSRFFDVLVDDAGRIVVAGSDAIVAPESQTSFLLQRYLADGTRDTTFGNEGQTRIDFNGAEKDNATAFGLTFDNDGKILVVGESNNFPALARVNP